MINTNKINQGEKMKNFIETLKAKRYNYVRNKNKIIVTNENNVYLHDLKELNENIIFTNDGDLFLDRAKKIYKNIIFANNGDVHLPDLKEVHGSIIFVNDGDLFLDNMEKLPKNAIFANKGSVYLINLKETHENTMFTNGGHVVLDKLSNKTITYNGNFIDIIIVNYKTMVVKKKESKGDLTMYKTEYLVGSNYQLNNSKYTIVEKDGKFAFGRTIEEAIKNIK